VARLPKDAVLILIDVQMAFVEWERAGLRRNNPGALENIVRLLDAFRQNGMTVIHVRHASTEPESALSPERSGYQPIEAAREREGEAVVVKHVNSSFIGTDLERRLRDHGHRTLVIAGITTNHCVETTTRMAGNLGFDAHLVGDACYTFDLVGLDGKVRSAEAIHDMTLTNLNGEFATIATADDIVAAAAENAAA